MENPELWRLGVPELSAQIRQSNRAVGHRGWGNRTCQLDTETAGPCRGRGAERLYDASSNVVAECALPLSKTCFAFSYILYWRCISVGSVQTLQNAMANGCCANRNDLHSS